MKLLSRLLLLSLIVAIVYGQDSIFECSSQAQTDLCNDMILPMYDECKANSTVDSNCAPCLFGCELVEVMGNTSSTTLTCANDTCVSDVCSSFGLFYNNSFGFSCRDVYSDQYCSYCEKCYSFRSDECSSDYKTTFCRLLPTDQLEEITCQTVYGPIPCSDCATLLEAQTCDQLSLQTLTTQQNDTLCEIGPYCDSLPNAVNCTMNNEFALDCRLCSYLFDNNFNCDFSSPTSGPPPAECATNEGLYCSLVNSADSCTSAYTELTCISCSSYSFCPPINIQTINMDIICNSADAAVCGVTVNLVYDECLNTSSSEDCDYCKATLPVCNYMPAVNNGTDNNNNDNLNVSCNSTAVTTCGYDVTFFPCALIHGLDYCISCIDALSLCGGVPEYEDDDIPPNLCDDEYYISLCDLVTNRGDCVDLLGDEICDFCENVVLVNCNSSSLDSDLTLDEFCSSSTLDTCLDVLSDNQLCADTDCTLCRARGTICYNYFSNIGSAELDDCYTAADDIYCRIYGANFTTCPSVYSTLCQTCQSKIVSCPIIDINNVPEKEQSIACFNSDVCPSVTSYDPFCQQGETFARLCDTCQGFTSVCENTSNTGGQSDFCNSDSGTLFCRAFALNTSECESRFTSGFCGLCQSTLLYCPTLSFDDFTHNQTAIACENSEICDVYVNSPPLCEGDTALFCDICIGFQDLCNSNNSGTPSICNSETGFGCYIGYSYFPCYSTAGNDTSGCEFCASVIDLCPSLVFNESIIPVEVCSNDTYIASCSLIVNDPFCEAYYGALTCRFCQSVFDYCQVSLDYTSVALELDSSCDSYYNTCQFLLSFVSADECIEAFTFADCAFCGVLTSYCPGRVGSYPNCSSELDYFCANISSLDNCNEVYLASTCYDCDVYRSLCDVNTYATINDFCSSTDYLFACSNIPIGPTCRHLSPQDSFLCDYCSLYTDMCVDSICSVDNLLTQCSSLYTNGTIPTVYIDQCLPCSLVSGVCNNYTIVIPSVVTTSFPPTTVNTVSDSIIMTTSTEQLLTTSTSIQQSSMDQTSIVVTTSQPITSGTSRIDQTTVQESSIDQTTSSMVMTTMQPTATSSISQTTAMVSSINQTTSMVISSTQLSVDQTTSVQITGSSSVDQTNTVTTVAQPSSAVSDRTTTMVTTAVSTTVQSSQSIVDTSQQAQSTTSSRMIGAETTTSEPTSTTSMGVIRSSTITTSTRAVQTSESPTRSSTPMSTTVSIDDLSDDQIDNAVTMSFQGLTLTMFRSNTDKFISDIELLINDIENSRRSLRQTNTVNVEVMIIDESVMELPNMELEFAIIATQDTNKIYSGSKLQLIVRLNGASLAQSIGASNFTSVREGVPDSIRSPTDESGGGLSSGATAGIVIVILFLVIIVLGGTAIGVYVYAVRNRKGRYYISNHDFTKGQELALSQSMKEADPDNVTPAKVIKNEETVSKEKEKEAESKLNGQSNGGKQDSSSSSSSDSSSSSESEDENTQF